MRQVSLLLLSFSLFAAGCTGGDKGVADSTPTVTDVDQDADVDADTDTDTAQHTAGGTGG